MKRSQLNRWGMLHLKHYRAFTAAAAIPLVLSVSMTAHAGPPAHAGAPDHAGPPSGAGPIPLTVPKAVCGANDNPETGLQGQVPAALRATGFEGFNCNLELIGQARGEGANWQSAQFTQGKHRTCGYHGTASPVASGPGRTQLGVRALDLSDRSNPTITAYLTTSSMLDPWESLKVNQRRQLLAADNAQNGGFSPGLGGPGPEVDIYDLSVDCRYPQLLASAPVGTGADGGIVVPIIGHEGSWAPDGLTYYGGDNVHDQYYAVDTSDPTAPKLLAAWSPGIAGTHGLSISNDGNRAYVISNGGRSLTALSDPNALPDNGLLIYDTSEIQAREPDPEVTLLGKVLWKDGSVGQHTIPVTIKGKPYVIFVDEGGSGGFGSDAQREAACAAGMSPFPMARIIDIGDETNPTVVSKVMLEVHDPANCDQVLPDVVGLTSFTYGTHYCSVDSRHNATTLACGMFNSGLRVFDIRDPLRPKEVAYYNPAGATTLSPGSNHATRNWHPGAPDWCSAQVHLDKRTGTLWSTCHDNGVLVLKFSNGVWPFPGSKTPPGMQN